MLKWELWKKITETWSFLSKKLAYPSEYIEKIGGFDLRISNIKKEHYFSRLKNDYPDDKQIERTDKLIENIINKKGRDLTRLYLKSDVFLIADDFERVFEVSISEFDINPLFCVSLPGYTWLWVLKC